MTAAEQLMMILSIVGVQNVKSTTVDNAGKYKRLQLQEYGWTVVVVSGVAAFGFDATGKYRAAVRVNKTSNIPAIVQSLQYEAGLRGEPKSAAPAAPSVSGQARYVTSLRPAANLFTGLITRTPSSVGRGDMIHGKAGCGIAIYTPDDPVAFLTGLVKSAKGRTVNVVFTGDCPLGNRHDISVLLNAMTACRKFGAGGRLCLVEAVNYADTVVVNDSMLLGGAGALPVSAKLQGASNANKVVVPATAFAYWISQIQQGKIKL